MGEILEAVDGTFDIVKTIRMKHLLLFIIMSTAGSIAFAQVQGVQVNLLKVVRNGGS